MENGAPLNILLVTEGSGGHLIPTLQVAGTLARRGIHLKVWYARRRPTARLAEALTEHATGAGVEVDPIDVRPVNGIKRCWQGVQLWRKAQRCFDTFDPDVVVGFGGWISVPVVLAARFRRIRCVLHEQNAVMGLANQWLARWVDRVALSFSQGSDGGGDGRTTLTGLPVRKPIGQWSHQEAARQFGFDPQRPTLLALGGSQGSRAINQLMRQLVERMTLDERHAWQIIHLVGQDDPGSIRKTYETAGLRAWVAPLLVQMEAAYAQADVALARAGASTIAELACSGTPAILIPYPYAAGHQQANARLVEAVGGGLVFRESAADPASVLEGLRRMMTDGRLRAMMSAQIRTLHQPDATERLAQTILELASAKARRCLKHHEAALHDPPVAEGSMSHVQVGTG